MSLHRLEVYNVASANSLSSFFTFCLLFMSKQHVETFQKCISFAFMKLAFILKICLRFQLQGEQRKGKRLESFPFLFTIIGSLSVRIEWKRKAYFESIWMNFVV